MTADTALAALQQKATARTRDGLSRFGIHAPLALGVAMADVQALGRHAGRDHALALALWKTGVYEARLLTAYVDEPTRVTVAQMDRWCRDFDNWAVCDTLCFKLFDQTPHAWSRIEPWAHHEREFVRRAAFALLASLAGHDKSAPASGFLATFPLIERYASDPRNFVKKGVSWALRRIGTRSPDLRAASVALARQLSASADPTARWVGKDALRDLTKAKREKPEPPASRALR